jgi:hypothetical protein
VTGKPNKNLPNDVKALARAYTKAAISTLGGIAENGISEAARVSACGLLLERGWGKSPQQVEHTGKDGDSEIKIILRTITEGKK